MVNLKSAAEITRMRASGAIVAEVLLELTCAAKAGVSTGELDRVAAREIAKRKAKSAFLGYRNYPANICTSVNANVVHGIPDDAEVLKDGDILSLDVGVMFQDYCGDAAVTVPIGNVPRAARRLMSVTQQSLLEAIVRVVPGKRLHDLSAAIQAHAEGHGYQVVRDLTGHGIGRQMHEEPSIPNFGKAGTGIRLEPGMVLAIEPMVNAGTFKTKVQANKWTVTTADGALSAHYEHTVAVTEDGPVVLTAL